MKKFQRVFFLSYLSLTLVFLLLIGYIISTHGLWGLYYFMVKLDKLSTYQEITKLIGWSDQRDNEIISINHDHLQFRKEELGQGWINGEVRRVFFADPGKPIKKTLKVEPGAVLDVSYGILPDPSDEKYIGNVKFSIVLEYQNKKEELLIHEVDNSDLRYHRYIKKRVKTNPIAGRFQVKTDKGWEDVKWHDKIIDLSSYAGKKVTLNFITKNMDSGSPWAVWNYPQIYQKNDINQDYNVIVVSLDTLRADHLNCYQYMKRITSPNMDKLAEEGILFKHFYSNTASTLSSQISILTGLYPSYHGISYRIWGGKYNFSFDELATMKMINKETLATTLADNGYNCGAYTGAGYFIANLDYSRGFHIYNTTADGVMGSVKNIFPKAFKWLEKMKNRKFFLFLHTYEIHTPYTEEFYVKKEAIPSYIKYKYTRALYDAGILTTDQYIGKLVSVLKTNKLLEKTILIITSDHGEELGDRYGFEGHGTTFFNEQIHVPCIIRLPKGFPQQKKINTVASSVDLVPTILDILGIKSQTKYSGKSLWPIINGNQDKDRFAYTSDLAHGPDLKSVVMYNPKQKDGYLYKYLYINPLSKRNWKRGVHVGSHIKEFYDPPRKRLFNLGRDPGETFNLMPENSEDIDSYQNIINEIMKGVPPFVPKKRKKTSKISQEAMDSLKALGYVQ